MTSHVMSHVIPLPRSLQGLVQHDSKLSASGTVFVDSVCRLIGLLLDYRNVSVDDKNRRMGCMFNLLVGHMTAAVRTIGQFSAS